MRRNEIFVHCCNGNQYIRQLFNKLKTEISYDPASPLLGIYLKELKAGSQRDICPPIYSNIIQNSQEVEATLMSNVH